MRGTTAPPYGSKQIWQLWATFAAASSTFAAAASAVAAQTDRVLHARSSLVAAQRVE